VSAQPSSDAAFGPVVSLVRDRVPSLPVLEAVLARTSEATVAAHLHVSVRTLRRYVAGEVKMNWVTRTRLQRLAEIRAI
jgi:hypothetical protein